MVKRAWNVIFLYLVQSGIIIIIIIVIIIDIQISR